MRPSAGCVNYVNMNYSVIVSYHAPYRKHRLQPSLVTSGRFEAGVAELVDKNN